MRNICAKFVPRVLRDQKERRCHDSREMVELINSYPAVLNSLVTCDESWIYFYDPETKRQNSQSKLAGSPRAKKATQSKSTHKLLMISFLTELAWSTCTRFPLDSQQGILFWGFKRVHEEIPSEEASTLQIGSVAFLPGQCTSPQLHPDYLTKMSIKIVPQPLYSPDFALCDFWLFPKFRGCRYETIEEMKEAVKKVIDTLSQEDFHGAFQKLLERYNMCIAAGWDYFDWN